MKDEVLDQLLDKNETIVLKTAPTKKLFTRNELIRLPISFSVIAIFLVYYCFFSNIDTNVLYLTLTVATIFIVYNVVIKTIIKAQNRSRTQYILTDKRIFFILKVIFNISYRFFGINVPRNSQNHISWVIKGVVTSI